MIILNNMYTGRYIKKQGKLGHETINLFKADDNKNYIWLNSMGVCSRKGAKGSTVILVRCINSKLYKVLGKAENCELLDAAKISRSKKKINAAELDDKTKRYNQQKTLNVTYNDKCPMDDIFEQDMFATFRSENVFKTKCDVYLTNDESLKDENNHVYCLKFRIGESMRHYIEDKKKIDYLEEKLLNKKDIWDEIINNVKNEKFNVEEPEFNFFKLIKKDKDELSISNSLAYFIDKDGIKSFFQDCLELKDKAFLKDDYELLREKHNIDISFFGKDHVVIIENKIDADITVDNKTENGKITTQVNNAVEKYFEGNECVEVNDKINKFINRYKGESSQLSKYYIYAIAYLLSKGKAIKGIEKYIKCYLLIPEYARGGFKTKKGYYNSNRNFKFQEKYKIITYKKISEYFSEKDIKDDYFKDFKSVLKPLAKQFNNEIEEEMKYRFFKAIGKI